MSDEKVYLYMVPNAQYEVNSKQLKQIQVFKGLGEMAKLKIFLQGLNKYEPEPNNGAIIFNDLTKPNPGESDVKN